MNIKEMNRRLQQIKRQNIKENIICIFILVIIPILIIISLIIMFTPTEKDKQAYNQCLNIYNNDVKLCNKIIYGNY